ncbi:MAG: SpoIIE family protein phosphatase [Coriobacteriales bacterium]|nr:SpoIIE family protein phosphatase [Coriobacteriales bacterium]
MEEHHETERAASLAHQPGPAPGQPVALSAGSLVVLAVILVACWVTSLISYPTFHTSVELFSIVVATTLFIVIWHSRRLLDNDYLLLVGFAMVFTAIIGVPHLLSFEGVELIPGFDTNLPTQLFIAQRLILGVSLFIAPLFLRRRLNVPVAVTVYSVATGLVLLSTFGWRNFPTMFVEGSGLTPLKIWIEYVIAALFVGAAVGLAQQRRRFDPLVFWPTLLALACFAASELAFSLYTIPTSVPNLIGHLFQVSAFYLMYRAVVVTALVTPFALLYRELSEQRDELDVSEKRQRVVAAQARDEAELLESILSSMADGLLVYDAEGRIVRWNERAEQLLGYSVDDRAYTIAERLERFALTDSRGRPMAASEYPAARALREGEVVEGETISLQAPGQPPLWLFASAAPIRRGTEIVGAVGTLLDITDLHELAEDQERLVTELAAANTTLSVEARLSDAVNDIDTRVNASLQFDDIVGPVLERAAEVTSADSAILLVSDGRDWKAPHVFGVERNAVQEAVERFGVDDLTPLDATPSPVIIDDVESEIGLQVLKQLGIGSAVGAPLFVAGGLVGHLLLARHGGTDGFTVQHGDFLRKVAASVALALNNSQLYEQERNIAATLQRSLIAMPDHLTGVRFDSLYRSATTTATVGGDFYDLFELQCNQVGILVGDVSGKGIEASALTSVVRNTMRAYAYDGYSPAECAWRVNELLAEVTPMETFCTLWFGILDLPSQELLYCNAGHPPGLLVRADGDVERLDPESPIVGAFKSLEYTNSKTVLRARDLLVLYTDGLTEASDGKTHFGVRRTQKALLAAREHGYPSRVPQQVFENAEQFAQGRLADDIALLALTPAPEYEDAPEYRV